MKVKQISLVAIASAIVLFALPRVGAGGPPLTATVQFGRPDVGSPFPPGSGHDASGHAKDSLVPRTVVISQGWSVTFEIGPFHRVAIYQAGTTPDDIDTTATVNLTVPFFIPNFTINDPNGRIALSPPAPLTTLSLVPIVWTTPPGTFNAPGRYLVTCTTVPHFVENDMFGWVIVK